jgi:hypothetical protein
LPGRLKIQRAQSVRDRVHGALLGLGPNAQGAIFAKGLNSTKYNRILELFLLLLLLLGIFDEAIFDEVW